MFMLGLKLINIRLILDNVYITLIFDIFVYNINIIHMCIYAETYQVAIICEITWVLVPVYVFAGGS